MARRALLMEDNDLVSRAISRVLKRGGYEVVAYADIDAVERLLETNTFEVEVVVADLNLKGHSSLSVIRRIIEVSPASRIVALSGELYCSELPDGVLYLEKPVSAHALLSALERNP